MIYKRGKRWRVIVYAGRDPITGRKRQKRVTVATRAEAKQAEARLVTEVGAGQHRGTRSKTVAELIERWLEWRQSVRPISPTTIATYRGYLDRVILPALGKLPVGRLDAATLDAFYAQLRKQGGKGGRPMAASSVRQVHAILSGALGRAVVWGWIAQNPARLATPPSVEKPDVTPPAVEEAARLLSVAQQEDAELGLFVRLAVVLGARRGELCALRWSDVDFHRGEVLIAGGVVRVHRQPLLDKPTKTHATSRGGRGPARWSSFEPTGWPSPRRARVRRDATGRRLRVLPRPRRLEADRPGRHLASLPPARQAPGHRVRLHDLRHFMVTQLVAGGVDWRTVSGRAGHADGHMTLGTYAHFQHEVLVGGEGLHRSPLEVLGTLLHEAAHGLACARSIQDTSRGGRYHNRRYATLARELGLDVAAVKPIGWSATVPEPTAAALRQPARGAPGRAGAVAPPGTPHRRRPPLPQLARLYVSVWAPHPRRQVHAR
jgi:integrase